MCWRNFNQIVQNLIPFQCLARGYRVALVKHEGPVKWKPRKHSWSVEQAPGVWHMVLEGKCAVFGGVQQMITTTILWIMINSTVLRLQQASTCFEHDTRLELRLNMCPWYAKNTEIFATTPSSWRFFQVGPTSHLTGTLVI